MDRLELADLSFQLKVKHVFVKFHLQTGQQKTNQLLSKAWRRLPTLRVCCNPCGQLGERVGTEVHAELPLVPRFP